MTPTELADALDALLPDLMARRKVKPSADGKAKDWADYLNADRAISCARYLSSYLRGSDA